MPGGSMIPPPRFGSSISPMFIISAHPAAGRGPFCSFQCDDADSRILYSVTLFNVRINSVMSLNHAASGARPCACARSGLSGPQSCWILMARSLPSPGSSRPVCPYRALWAGMGLTSGSESVCLHSDVHSTGAARPGRGVRARLPSPNDVHPVPAGPAPVPVKADDVHEISQALDHRRAAFGAECVVGVFVQLS